MAKSKIQPESKPKKVNWHAVSNKETNKSYSKSSDSLNEYSSFLPVIFQSPYIDTDLQIFEGIYANTFIGRIIDVRVKSAIGKCVRPTFILNDKKIKDHEEKQEKLKQYDKYIEILEDIDRNKKINMTRRAEGLLRNMHIFGRACLGIEDGIQGDHPPSLPIALKQIHPRDLGRVFVHQLDWSVSSVYAFQKTQLLKKEDMIYLAQLPESPIRRSLNYGYSSIQRLMGQSRALRRMNEFDIPQAMEGSWADYPTVRVDNDGMTEAEKTTDLTTIRNGWKPAAVNIISGKKDEIEVFNIEHNVKLAEMSVMKEAIERDALGQFNVPGGMFGREQDQTRATMLSKIQLYTALTVEEDRNTLGECLAEQWYERNLIVSGYEDILQDVSIEVTFDPIVVEQWTDKIPAVQQLDTLTKGRIPIDELLRLLDLEDLIPKLQKEQPMEDPNNPDMKKPKENIPKKEE